jgi:hypothetical protein
LQVPYLTSLSCCLGSLSIPGWSRTSSDRWGHYSRWKALTTSPQTGDTEGDSALQAGALTCIRVSVRQEPAPTVRST